MKFLNSSIAPQTIYLPSRTSFTWPTERTIIDVEHSIELEDPRDLVLMRKLCAKGFFIEVPDDQLTKDYRSSRISI